MASIDWDTNQLIQERRNNPGTPKCEQCWHTSKTAVNLNSMSFTFFLSTTRAPEPGTQPSMMDSIHCVPTLHMHHMVIAAWLSVHSYVYFGGCLVLSSLIVPPLGHWSICILTINSWLLDHCSKLLVTYVFLIISIDVPQVRTSTIPMLQEWTPSSLPLITEWSLFCSCCSIVVNTLFATAWILWPCLNSL